MQLEYKALPLRGLKAAAEGGEFEGLAACFHNVDDSFWPDIIAPGAFAADLPEFLAEGFVSGLNHDWDQPIGRPLAAEETREGLQVRGSICDTQAGRDLRTLLQGGVIKRLSIGFRTLGRTWLETSDEVAAYWAGAGYTPSAEDIAGAQGGARLLTRIKLYEFGPVAVPANKRAAITAVKDLDEGGRPGRSFDSHSQAVLAAVAEWTERAQQLHELRAQDGRGLAPERLVEIRRLHGALGGLLTACESTSAPLPLADRVRAEAIRFEELTARLRGAPVGS